MSGKDCAAARQRDHADWALRSLRAELLHQSTNVPGLTEDRISYGDGYQNGLMAAVGELDRKAPWVPRSEPVPDLADQTPTPMGPLVGDLVIAAHGWPVPPGWTPGPEGLSYKVWTAQDDPAALPGPWGLARPAEVVERLRVEPADAQEADDRLSMMLGNAQDRLDTVRKAIEGLGFFEPDEIGPDLAPRVVEVWSALTGALIDARAALYARMLNAGPVSIERNTYSDGYASGLGEALHIFDREVPWVARGQVPPRAAPKPEPDDRTLRLALSDPGAIVGRKRGPSWPTSDDAWREEIETLTQWQARAVRAVYADPEAHRGK